MDGDSKFNTSPSKNLTEGSKSTPSATSFFFKAKPKQLLSSVKRCLSQNDDDDAVRSLPPAKVPATSSNVNRTSALSHPSEQGEVIASSKEPYPVSTPPTTAVSPKSASPLTFIDLSDDSDVLPPNIAPLKLSAPTLTTRPPNKLAVTEPTDNIDPLLREVAQKFASSTGRRAPASATPLKMIINDDFPYYFGDKANHRTEKQILPVHQSTHYAASHSRHVEGAHLESLSTA